MCIMQRYTYFLITESGVSGFWLLDVADHGTGCVRILGPRLLDVADYGTGSYPEPPHG